MVVAGPAWCPEFRPSKEEFSQPFCTYISKVLKENPDIAMFKVIPPPGWSPRKKPFPKLSSTDIACPIRQHVFGTRGAYRCVLIEQKPMSAADYRTKVDKEGKPPPSNHRNRDDELRERAFWSSITINPPVYGADTPQSFFDEKLPYGWNLRNLGGCLLKKYGIADIPGVTTPMTYFGMWKSFFSWHVEDADLFSINYLHFGQSKVWYCVAPSQRAKFERMAQSLFPELHRACPSFMRHKDILLSPYLLRTYNIDYVQARQEPNQFIVLNAGAYHSGYNLGFNCAEAVNFATEEWLEIGRSVKRCTCSALKDGVRISMRTFGFSDSDSDTDDESDDDSDSDESDDEGSEAGSGPGSEEEEDEESAVGHKRQRAGAASKGGGKRRARSADSSGAVAAAKGGSSAKHATSGARRGSAAAAASPPASPKGRTTKTAAAAAAAAKSARSTHASADARAKLAAKGGVAKRPGRPPKIAPRTPDGRATNAAASPTATAASAAKGGSSKKAVLAKGAKKPLVAGDVDGPSGEPPKVIISEDGKGRRQFYMVQVLRDVKAKKGGDVVMRWLKEDKDGLFRPSADTWEERAAALVDVRTQWVKGAGHKPGGYRLLTLRSRVLDCDLVD